MHSAYGGKGERLAKEGGVEIARSGRQTERGLKKFQKNKKKVCRIKKVSYLCSPKRLRGCRTEFGKKKERLKTREKRGRSGHRID